MKKLSIVIPVFCEESILPSLLFRLEQVRESLAYSLDLDFIFVDDGSTDSSLSILRQYSTENPHVTVVSLSRNFGHQAALLAGIYESRADATIVMDSDLQDPPELIPQLIEQWENGFDVVYAQRKSRSGETFFKRASASIFYRLVDWLSETNLPRNVGDYRLMDKAVVDVLKQMPEKSLYLRGMVSWVGFRQTAVQFDRDPRTSGETNYSLAKMVRLATDAILSFSERPLRVVTAIGLVTTTLAFFLSVYFFGAIVFFDSPKAAGWLSLILAILLLGGVQLICLGILGQYISRIYRETKSRPLFIIDNKRSVRR